MAFPSSRTEKDESGTDGTERAFPLAGSATHRRRRHLLLSPHCGPSTSATITTTSSSRSSGSSSRHLVNKGQAIRHLDGQLICHPLDKRVSVRSCPRGLIPQQAVKVKRFKEHLPTHPPSIRSPPSSSRFPAPPGRRPPPSLPGAGDGAENSIWDEMLPTLYKTPRLRSCHPLQ